jgi:hypothetical protein
MHRERNAAFLGSKLKTTMLSPLLSVMTWYFLMCLSSSISLYNCFLCKGSASVFKIKLEATKGTFKEPAFMLVTKA